jgi:hypothetical protein
MMLVAEVAKQATRSDELTDAQRHRIEGSAMAAALIRAGFSPAQIARQWGLTRMGVVYRVEQWEAMRASDGS